jgi:hypothetical protein
MDLEAEVDGIASAITALALGYIRDAKETGEETGPQVADFLDLCFICIVSGFEPPLRAGVLARLRANMELVNVRVLRPGGQN